MRFLQTEDGNLQQTRFPADVSSASPACRHSGGCGGGDAHGDASGSWVDVNADWQCHYTIVCHFTLQATSPRKNGSCRTDNSDRVALPLVLFLPLASKRCLPPVRFDHCVTTLLSLTFTCTQGTGLYPACPEDSAGMRKAQIAISR